MLSTILLITTPLTVWGVSALVVRLLPPPATHLPETTDSPSRQLDKMGANRVSLTRGRDGSWTRVETFKCSHSGAAYKRTVRS